MCFKSFFFFAENANKIFFSLSQNAIKEFGISYLAKQSVDKKVVVWVGFFFYFLFFGLESMSWTLMQYCMVLEWTQPIFSFCHLLEFIYFEDFLRHFSKWGWEFVKYIILYAIDIYITQQSTLGPNSREKERRKDSSC